MKKIAKVLTVTIIIAICVMLAGCQKVGYVFNEGFVKSIGEVKDGSWNSQDDAAQQEEKEDTPVIDDFVQGTYSGVNFNTQEDLVNYYIKAYDNTKSQTAVYINSDGKEETRYAFLGTEELDVGTILIDGNENSMVNKVAPGIVNGIFVKGVASLPPYYSSVPSDDNNLNDDTRKNDHNFDKCMLSSDDILACNATQNDDGTLTVKLQPKAANNSLRGDDSQGRAFEALGDIAGIVSQISVMSFSQGDVNDNITVNYNGGVITAKIDPKSEKIVEADYEMNADVSVKHVNAVGIIKDKSAALNIKFKNHFPADSTYLKDVAGISVK